MNFFKYHINNSRLLGIFLIIWGVLAILSYKYRPDDFFILSISWVTIFVINLFGDYYSWRKYKKRNEIK